MTHSPTTGQFLPRCSSPEGPSASKTHSTPRHPSDGSANTTASPVPPSKRVRTTFSSNELAMLEASYYICEYPDTPAKQMVADALGFAHSTITVWFQNRRARGRRNKWKTKYFNLASFTEENIAVLRKFQNACLHAHGYTPLFPPPPPPPPAVNPSLLWPLLF